MKWLDGSSCAAGAPTRFDGPAFLTPKLYAAASEQAHCVLGIAVAAIACAWGALVVAQKPADACYAASGAVSLCAGFYLQVWVWFLVAPSHAGAELDAFSARDLVQRQHAAIAWCLSVAGLAEVLHARALRRRPSLLAKDWVHSLWFGAIACVALVFVGHPQRAPAAVASHVLVGVCLLAGGYLLQAEKKAGFRSDALDAPAAGVCVAVAAVILVAYREPTESGLVHRGVEVACEPGGPLAVLSFAYAAGVFLVLLGAAFADARRGRPSGYELARREDWPAAREEG